MENILTNKKAALAGGFGTAIESVTPLSYPSPKSVKGRVLGALLSGQRLTHLDCWVRFGSSRLSHHVYMLRSIGWPVAMLEKVVITSDAGRPATIGEYWLPTTSVQTAGDAGAEYSRQCSLIEDARRGA